MPSSNILSCGLAVLFQHPARAVPAGVRRGSVEPTPTNSPSKIPQESSGANREVALSTTSSNSESDKILKSPQSADGAGQEAGEEPSKAYLDAVAEMKYTWASNAFETKEWDVAASFARESAEAGNANAMGLLGRLYYLGRGVPQDAQLARHWYEKAAAAGNCSAMYMLGLYYKVGGNGFPKDSQLARQWYQQGAGSGSSGQCQESCKKELRSLGQ